MAQVPEPKDQWYVVQVLSGQEMKVQRSIVRRIESEEMADFIYEALVPTETVSEVRRGKKIETKRKFYPGYILINMHLLNDDGRLEEKSWYFIQDTPGVINFAGAKNRPVPMRASEVESMLSQIQEREEGVTPKIQFEVGDTVKVADGPFEGQTGVVEEIDQDKGELLVSVDIFGRSTPVPLEYWQVERD